MSKLEFLKLLRKNLSQLSLVEQEDIINEYLSIFDFKSEEGLSEAAICEELGQPDIIARQFIDELANNNNTNNNNNNNNEYHYEELKKPNNFVGRTFIFIGLVFISMIFTMPLALGFGGVLIGLWAVWLGLLLVSFSFLIAMPYALLINVGSALFCLGLVGLLFCLLLFISKLFIKFILWYGKLFINIVKGEL